VFQGASSIVLDAKGRLSVPTRHRDVLSATAASQITITKHPHGCLMIFPRNEWEKFRGISKDTVLLGMGSYFELWDAATYAAQEAEQMKGEMPDVFKDFSF
jgi:MraZ protein